MPTTTASSSQSIRIPMRPANKTTTDFDNLVAPGTKAPLVPAQAFKRNPLVIPDGVIAEYNAGRGVAAQADVFAANAKTQKFSYFYETGKPKEINLLSKPANDKLQLTVVAHVSGHTQQAAAYAKDPNEGFTIRVTDPSGQAQTLQVKHNPKETKQYVFAQDIEFDVSKPGNYVIEAFPSATSTGGYIEGREYILHVGKENFVNPKLATTSDEGKAGAAQREPNDASDEFLDPQVSQITRILGTDPAPYVAESFADQIVDIYGATGNK